MADSYEINDPTETEQITLEEEAANLPTEDATGERPAWLPETVNSA